MHPKRRLIPQYPKVQFIRWGVPREDEVRELSILINNICRFRDIRHHPLVGWEVIVADERVSTEEWYLQHGLAFVFSSITLNDGIMWDE